MPQYLEGDNSNSDTTYAAGPETSNFNDRLLLITRDMLMPSVEQRVARQARRCLENYALSASGLKFNSTAPVFPSICPAMPSPVSVPPVILIGGALITAK